MLRARDLAEHKPRVSAAAGSLLALQEEHGIVLRFVVGFAADPKRMEDLSEEEKQHGEMLRVGVLERYQNLALKVLRYFEAALGKFAARYLLKVDDDVYLQPLRIPLAVSQWTSRGADYVGCFMDRKAINKRRRGAPSPNPRFGWVCSDRRACMPRTTGTTSGMSQAGDCSG